MSDGPHFFGNLESVMDLARQHDELAVVVVLRGQSIVAPLRCRSVSEEAVIDELTKIVALVREEVEAIERKEGGPVDFRFALCAFDRRFDLIRQLGGAEK